MLIRENHSFENGINTASHPVWAIAMKLVWILMSLQLMLLATALSARRCVTPTTAPEPTEDPDDPTDDPWDPTDDTTEDPWDPTDDSTEDPWDPTDDPSNSTDTTEKPTEEPSDPTGYTTETPSNPTEETTEEPTDPTVDPTENPSDPTEETTEEPASTTSLAPSDSPTDSPTDAETSATDKPTDDPLGPTTSGPSATTYPTPSVDANASCRTHKGVQFLPHPYDCHLYIHCDGDIGYVMDCPSDLYWNSVNQTCDETCA